MAEKEKDELKLDDAGIIGKITMATIKTNPAAVKQVGGDNPEEPCATIYGVCTGIYEKTDKASGITFVGFQGMFEAINLQTGELYHSGVMYLPAGISEQFQSVVTAHQDKDGNVSLDFGFQINSIPAKNPAGYSYKAFALKKAMEADPLEALRADMRKAVKGKSILDQKKLKA